MSDICIVGGGLTGTMMAIALSYTGSAVTLARPEPPPLKTRHIDNRTTTIHAAGKSMLDVLGVWANIKITPTHINKVMVAEGADKLLRYQTNFNLDWHDSAHPMAYVVNNQSLLDALHFVLESRPVKIIQPANINGMHVTGDKAQLHCVGEKLPDFDLVVACDGAQSQMRASSKLRYFRAPHRQTAVVATLALDYDHENTAFQRFLSDGPIALMPSGNQLMSLVWTMQKANAKNMLAIDEKDFDIECNKAFGPRLGHMRVVGKRHGWPLQPLWMPKLGKNHLLFSGDAGHSLHPLAGQGYNMSLADAAILADCIKLSNRHGLSAGHTSVQQNYQRRRQVEVAAMTVITSGLNIMMSYAPRKVAKLTGVGMSLVNASPLKGIFQSIASGGVLSRANLLNGQLPD